MLPLPKGLKEASLPSMGVELDGFVAGMAGSLLLHPSEFIWSRKEDDAMSVRPSQAYADAHADGLLPR